MTQFKKQGWQLPEDVQVAQDLSPLLNPIIKSYAFLSQVKSVSSNGTINVVPISEVRSYVQLFYPESCATMKADLAEILISVDCEITHHMNRKFVRETKNNANKNNGGNKLGRHRPHRKGVKRK